MGFFVVPLEVVAPLKLMRAASHMVPPKSCLVLGWKMSPQSLCHRRIFLRSNIFALPLGPLFPLPRSKDTGLLFPCSTLNKTPEDLAAEGDDIHFETEHDQRKRHLSSADPVHTVNLKRFFQAQLIAMAQELGKERSVLSHGL